MVTIPVRKEKLFKTPEPPTLRRWAMPPRKLTLKDFKTLLNRRNKTLQKMQKSPVTKDGDNNRVRGSEGTKGNSLDVSAGGVKAIKVVKEKEEEVIRPVKVLGVVIGTRPSGVVRKVYAASQLKKLNVDIPVEPLNYDAEVPHPSRARLGVSESPSRSASTDMSVVSSSGSNDIGSSPSSASSGGTWF